MKISSTVMVALAIGVFLIVAMMFYPRPRPDVGTGGSVRVQQFKQFLHDCEPGQVRFLWFSSDSIYTGITTWIDLRSGNLESKTDIYDWAVQGGDGRISTSAAAELAGLAAATPPDDASVYFTQAVYIALWQNGALSIKSWRRTALPPDVLRIFDLAAMKIDTRPRQNTSRPSDDTTQSKSAYKTDASNGSNGICRVSNVLHSPSPDPSR